MATIEEYICCELKMMACYEVHLLPEQFNVEKHVAALASTLH
jgi:hypothetical protein